MCIYADIKGQHLTFLTALTFEWTYFLGLFWEEGLIKVSFDHSDH